MAKGIVTSASADGQRLVHLVFETTLGAFYTFPDMVPDMVGELLIQFDVRSEQIVARNLSGTTLVLPFKILAAVWGLKGDDDIDPEAPLRDRMVDKLWSCA